MQHIGVCVCTYKRPELLRRTLEKLAIQETGRRFTYSITVVDNDDAGSAEAVVSGMAAKSPVPVTYCIERVRGICAARNTAIERSTGNFVAFIDDDEFPESCWLSRLFETIEKHDVAGVLGPVESYFDEKPPDWVIECGFFNRPRHPTGFVIDGAEGRTGNVLLRRRLFSGVEAPFDPKFHRGGDTDFFRRMVQQGHTFIWCDEAVVYEVVPPVRWTRSFMLRRALLRGAITLKSPTFGARSVAKSVGAAIVYAISLPFAFLFRHDTFMRLLVKLCDHLGKLLAVVGIHPVRSPYSTD